MLSQAENALLCEVDPGKPMNEALKRYWIPVALSSDIPGPDSDPVRVTALCEDYVLFRDSEGRPGLLREQCCHRGASLCLGRVEESGIRCIYHGWKFDIEGTILDMPNCSDEKFLTRYRQPAFPVRDAGGFIFAYLGPKEKEPPFPHLPFFDVPASHRFNECPVFNANYVQVLEGGLDSSHLSSLHFDTLKILADANPTEDKFAGQIKGSTANSLTNFAAPSLEIEDMSYGFRYAAIRQEPTEGLLSVGVTAFVMPFFCLLRGNTSCIMAMPVNNEKTHFFHVFWDPVAPMSANEAEARRTFGLDEAALSIFGLGRDFNGAPGTATRANHFLQDREAMRRGDTYSGLMNFVPEDAAVVASAGGIYDRQWENLVPSDLAIVKMRRLLLGTADRVQRGEEPIGIHHTENPNGVEGTIEAGTPWQSLYDRGAALQTA